MTGVAIVLCGLGLALLVVGTLRRTQERDDRLLQLIELPYAEEDATPEDLSRLAGLRPRLRAVGEALERVHPADDLQSDLQRANLPLRAGEALTAVAIVSVLFALWCWAVVGQPLFAIVGLVALPLTARAALRRRIAVRRRAIEEQLPNAFSLLASSLKGGHSLLHAVEHLVSEMDAPLSEEFARVLAATRLGDPLVDAMERMAERLQIEDLDWAVQAIRIQQSVGGRLADLLFTLADTLRARDEFRREVRVLTAEGRMSAAVLAGLPIFVLLGLQAANPTYMADLFSGLGLFLLGAAAISVAIGVTLVLRMVKVEM